MSKPSISAALQLRLMRVCCCLLFPTGNCTRVCLFVNVTHIRDENRKTDGKKYFKISRITVILWVGCIYKLNIAKYHITVKTGVFILYILTIQNLDDIKANAVIMNNN